MTSALAAPDRRRRAFTLVELLVVIGIIAILIGIILPVMSAARQAGNLAACMSNLRQIGMAAAMYSNDQKGNSTLPIIVKWDPGFQTVYWPIILTQMNYLKERNLYPGFDITGKSALFCPSVPVQPVRAWEPNPLDNYDGIQWYEYDRGGGNKLRIASSYGLAGGNFPGPTTGDKQAWRYPQAPIGLPSSSDATQMLYPAKLGQIKRPTDMVMAMDGIGFNPFGNPARIAAQRHATRSDPYVLARWQYTGRANVLFFDGHVQTIHRKDLPPDHTFVGQGKYTWPLWTIRQQTNVSKP